MKINRAIDESNGLDDSAQTLKHQKKLAFVRERIVFRPSMRAIKADSMEISAIYLCNGKHVARTSHHNALAVHYIFMRNADNGLVHAFCIGAVVFYCRYFVASENYESS